MFLRRISIEDVRNVLSAGEAIEEYPDDTPYPGRLVLGWCGSHPLHAVVAYNMEAEETIVFTVYEPDPDEWEPVFKRRKRP